MSKWTRAQRQARRIKEAKTGPGKRRSVRTWCRQMKEALHASAD